MVRGRLFALVVLLAIGAGAGTASAATITVNTNFDDQNQGDGQCSLRKAVQDVDTPGSGQTDCAPAAFGANTIVLAAGRYQLGPAFPGPGQQLTIAPTVTNLTIAGANENTTSIDAQSLGNRVFLVSSGANVTLQNVAVLNGSAPAGATGATGVAGQAGSNGGAILNQGTLAVVNSAITNSRAGNGGAGGAAGSSGPGGDGGPGGSGGGIYNSGRLTLNGATIGSNVAAGGGSGGAGAQGAPGTDGGNGGAGGTGGGIENAGGALTVIGSTIRGNTAGNGGVGGTGGSGASPGNGGNGGNGSAGANGGGIWSDGGTLSVTNSTFASNAAGAGGTGGSGAPGTIGGNGGTGGNGGGGGGLGAATPSSATLLEVTTAGNNAGTGGTGGSAGTPGGTAGASGAAGSAGGVLAQGSSITLRNSLLALNSGGNCSSSVLDGGFNLSFGDSSCPGTFLSGDPNLGPLQNNGGPAPTISLQPGSAAINQLPASGAGCTATDERGAPRPTGSSGSKCDIGAYEVVGPVAVTGAASKISLNRATISGGVIPYAGSASVVFQYGTTTKYGSTTATQHIGGVTTAAVTANLGSLKPNTRYHYRLVIVAMDGTAVGGDRAFTTSVIPAITGLKVAPGSFRAARGTTISYKDSLAATTTLTAFRCVKSRHGRCTRFSRLGSLTHRDAAGANKVTIKGRFGRARLAVGRYRLQLTPRSGGRSGKTATTTFRVL